MADLPLHVIDSLLAEATSEFASYICSLRTALISGTPIPTFPALALPPPLPVHALLSTPSSPPPAPALHPSLPHSPPSPVLPISTSSTLLPAPDTLTPLLHNLELLLDQSFQSFLADVLPPPSPAPSPLPASTPALSSSAPSSITHSNSTAQVVPTLVTLSPHPSKADPKASAPAHLTVAHLNSRSLVGHATEISDYISLHDLDILAISETWLHSAAGHAAQLATPDGYSISRADRIASTLGGGVALIYRNSLDIHQVTIPIIDGCDILLVKALINPNTSISFFIGYRPPRNARVRGTIPRTPV